ncbi:MAG: efflux RND transporter periplasmic adaptor subunit, partial [Candidatus Aminicenantes bacterium]|nr:efflux RND transporter periplasmic adaptor subunit [Candidatus Aminicenantes bacterium]
KKKKKLIIIAIVIPVVVLIGAFSLKSLFKPAEAGSFQFAKIKRGDLENIVSSTGTLSAVETVEVGSQVSGIIEKIRVDFNDEVKKSQVLAVLDKTLFAVAVRDAEAGVLRAQAKLAQADAEVRRNRPLFDKGHLSEMEFLVTKTTLEIAKADLKIAEAALHRAKTNLSYTVIRSPIDGTVIERTVDAGQTIAANFQAPKLFVIAEDLTRMQIETNVDESDIGQIKENQSVRFTVQAYPDDTFSGKVRQIRLQPTTIQNVVNYTVVVNAANEKGMLLPGMTATVDFLIEERRDVLLVPNMVLNFKPSMDLMSQYGPRMMEKMRLKQGGGNMMPGAGMVSGLPDNKGMVFYLDTDGMPDMVVIKKGATDGLLTEILGSTELKEGMQVITAFKTKKKSASSKKSSLLMPPPPPEGGF